MSELALPQRLVQYVGQSPVAEQAARFQESFYRPILGWAVRSVFHSDVLGHSLHPPLTDVTFGCWLSASVLDIAGGERARPGATLLVGSGLVTMLPTALAGAADWTELSGDERRIGAAHGIGVDCAILLFTGSLIARTRGRHALGVGLGLAGNAVLAGAAFLGGHLALNRGTARRHPTGSA